MKKKIYSFLLLWKKLLKKLIILKFINIQYILYYLLIIYINKI
jgi:hypothetical protein